MLKFSIAGFLCAFTGYLGIATASASEWSYGTGRDTLDDTKYSYAIQFKFDYQYNDDFSIGFQCKNGDVRFEINAGTLINGHNEVFKFIYRVDKRPAQSVMMRTYINDGEGGYTYKDAEKVAKDIFGGSRIFVRAIGWDNQYIETTISLNASDRNIKRVFRDCGKEIAASDTKNIKKDDYTFEKFKSDFSKRTVKEQIEILAKIRKIMREK